MKSENGRGTSIIRLYKFRDPDGKIENLIRSGIPADLLYKIFPDRFVGYKEHKGNTFLNEGINFIWQAVMGSSGLTYFGSNSCIGIGDGAQSESPSQTGLTGANRYYKQVDSGYPQLNNTQLVFQATFGTSEANFAWNEWTVANGCADSYININRKAVNLGTKQSGYTWVFQVWLTIT
jgi:hypothetical protein